MPVKCDISSLNIAIHVLTKTTELEEHFLHLEKGESTDLGNTFWQAHFGKKLKTHLGRGSNKPSTEVLSSLRPRVF